MRTRTRKLEAENRKRDETASLAEMSDNDLWSAIYRLQGRRNPRLIERMAALISEQKRRREVAR